MASNRYERPPAASVGEVDSAVAAGDPVAAAGLLVGLALHTEVAGPAEQLCRRLLDGPDRQLAGVAATCLGHLARRFGRLDADSVSALVARRSDPDIGGRVDDAMDDVEVFTDQDDRGDGRGPRVLGSARTCRW